MEGHSKDEEIRHKHITTKRNSPQKNDMLHSQAEKAKKEEREANRKEQAHKPASNHDSPDSSH